MMKIMRNRAWRRKKTESKWNSRCKKFLFMSLIRNTEDDNDNINVVRKASSWKEMKQRDPSAKHYKNGVTFKTYKSDKYDNRQHIKSIRLSSKKLIIDGIEEYGESD